MASSNQFDVFLSHNSKDRQMVRQVAEALKQRGLHVWLDEWELVPGRPWQEALEEIIKTTKSAAVLVGKDGLGPWEQPEMRACLDQFVRRRLPVIPVLLPNVSGKPDLPLFLQAFTWIDLRAGLTDAGVDRLVWGITGRKTGSLTTDLVRAGETVMPLVSIASLPAAAEHFVGRKVELRTLDEAWNSPATNVVSLVAFGGVGKSALVAEWLRQLALDNWRGAERVIGHSFYSQGSREDGQASAEPFIDWALRLLGDDDPPASSPWEKGGRLARLIRQSRVLLVLDGLEPLQYGPSAGHAGQIRDPALQTLVRELAAANPGLCVLTTREKIPGLPGAPVIDLEQLLDVDGAALLRALGVQGTEAELREASRAVRGHGLALTLLGNYLRKACGGDVRRVAEVELSKADHHQGRNARKLMEHYERWFESKEPFHRRAVRWLRHRIGLPVTYTQGERMRAILLLLGLFDRPAEADCVEAICTEPAIPGLTNSLVGLSKEDWNWAVSNLRDCGLVAKPTQPNRPCSIPDCLDAHPLVREHFDARLSELLPKASREAHRRIYEHLKHSAPERPSTLQEMMTLYHAVAHGCKAGTHLQALQDVYIRRICRGDEFYNINVLSAHSADLAALSKFFDLRWDRLNSDLEARHEWRVLNWTGFRLRTLGRMEDAERLFRRAIHQETADGNWKMVATNGVNRSQILLLSGRLTDAIHQAVEALLAAELSADVEIRTFARTTLGQGLHWCGQVDASAQAFSEAEALVREHDQEPKILWSTGGFKYCDLLLDVGKQREAKERALIALRFAEPHGWSMSIGLAHLSLALAELRIGGDSNRAICSEHFEAAVKNLRKSGYVEFLVLALLARSRFLRIIHETNRRARSLAAHGETQSFDGPSSYAEHEDDNLARAENDLEEAELIAHSSDMLISQIEAALERTQMSLAFAQPRPTPPKSEEPHTEAQRAREEYLTLARKKLAEVKTLIRQTECPYEPHHPNAWEWKPPSYMGNFNPGDIVGYRRCDEEVKALEAILK